MEKKNNLLDIIGDNVEINLTQTGLQILQLLEKCYDNLQTNLRAAYDECYGHDNAEFDGLCRSLEKNIRLVEYLIWTIKQSKLSSYINNGYDLQYTTNLPKFDFKALYDSVCIEMM